MKYLYETDWENVFDGWRGNEASDPGWIECATKVKGWPDWESWRRYSAAQIGAAERKWEQFEFEKPLSEIPEMLVGPFGAWQSRHSNKHKFTFDDLIAIPEQFEFWRNHSKIRAIIENFPSPTEFIGLIREDLGKVVCLEGHHRATALAVARREGLEVKISTAPRIALATLAAEEVALLDEAMRKGSVLR